MLLNVTITYSKDLRLRLRIFATEHRNCNTNKIG